MLRESPAPLNAAQKAWATRWARDAARADIATLNAGVVEPSTAFNPKKPVVDLNIDDAKVGCGMRRYVVLDVGPRVVRLFYYPLLATVVVDRLTFDRKARPAKKTDPRVIARIIRENLARVDRVNSAAGTLVLSDGGPATAQALQVLR